MKVSNRFGEGNIITIEDIIPSRVNSCKEGIYLHCAACTSIFCDMNSWAKQNIGQLLVAPVNDSVCNIVIGGCQVTDLAILNDLNVANRMHQMFPKAKIFMGGCLGQHFDIPLPEWLHRIDVFRSGEKGFISHENEKFVSWEKPFWINPTGKKTVAEHVFSSGNEKFLRHDSKAHIGAGCHGNCAYCTIRDTRGAGFQTTVKDFESTVRPGEIIALISDSPSKTQIKEWHMFARDKKLKLLIRNVEPHVALDCQDALLDMAIHENLVALHVPVQHTEAQVLKCMHRNVQAVPSFLKLAKDIKKYNVYLATNIIIDYKDKDGCMLPDPDMSKLNEIFDLVNWNPYFDGKWDRKKAEEKFMKYFSWNT